MLLEEYFSSLKKGILQMEEDEENDLLEDTLRYMSSETESIIIENKNFLRRDSKIFIIRYIIQNDMIERLNLFKELYSPFLFYELRTTLLYTVCNKKFLVNISLDDDIIRDNKNYSHLNFWLIFFSNENISLNYFYKNPKQLYSPISYLISFSEMKNKLKFISYNFSKKRNEEIQKFLLSIKEIRVIFQKEKIKEIEMIDSLISNFSIEKCIQKIERKLTILKFLGGDFSFSLKETKKNYFYFILAKIISKRVKDYVV